MAAYLVFSRTRTKNPAEMETYGQKVGASVAGHSFVPLVRYGDYEVLEGDPIEGGVVLKFDDMAAARAWYHSPAYQEAAKHRHAGADYQVVLFEGA